MGLTFAVWLAALAKAKALTHRQDCLCHERPGVKGDDMG
jgi:hypothetical protein